MKILFRLISYQMSPELPENKQIMALRPNNNNNNNIISNHNFGKLHVTYVLRSKPNQYVTCMLALMLYVPFNIFSITTSDFLLSSLVDPVLSRLYKSVLLKESTQCPDESRTSDPRSPLSKWKIKKLLIKCRTDWKNYRHTRSGYSLGPGVHIVAIFSFLC